MKLVFFALLIIGIANPAFSQVVERKDQERLTLTISSFRQSTQEGSASVGRGELMYVEHPRGGSLNCAMPNVWVYDVSYFAFESADKCKTIAELLSDSTKQVTLQLNYLTKKIEKVIVTSKRKF